MISKQERETQWTVLEEAYAKIDPTQAQAIYIFDMDGTLYQLDGENNGYGGSSLEKTINTNAALFAISQEGCTLAQAESLVAQAVQDRVGLSRFFATRYKLTRADIFEAVWDISPEQIIKNDPIAYQVVSSLKQNEQLCLSLLTSAPRIWQLRVLEYLGLDNCFQAAVAGDDFGTKLEVFDFLAQRYSACQITSIGDQLNTDILPAQSLGFETLLITQPADLLTLIN